MQHRSPSQENLHNFHLENRVRRLNFGSAMNEVLNGKKVRRLDWKDEGVYLVIKDERLLIFKTDDGSFDTLIVSAGDIAGTDWVVIEEGKGMMPEDRVIH